MRKAPSQSAAATRRGCGSRSSGRPPGFRGGSDDLDQRQRVDARFEARTTLSAAAGRPARVEQEARSPAANDNLGSRNPTIVDLPGEISDDCRSKFAKVLARILV